MNLDDISKAFDLDKVQAYPLDKWTPDLSGDIDIRVAKDGRWFHEGGEISRKPLLRLFASLVKQEGNEFFLVTPVEKWRIKVEDTPLHVISLVGEPDAGVSAVLSNGQVELLDSNSGITLTKLDENDIPVITTAQGLTARFLRSAYYQLLEMGELTEGGFSMRSGQSSVSFTL
ncbi:MULTISPECIES: DUF1285 domain-containing protein [Thalassolituus]|jgi:hypothetical protein|uniref:DUF1285 domain-containing protein n=1 Tax=Thalassolituus TaxID=187492 RepID=UPI0007D015B9|nr:MULTISPECIES: DUF1285 domain-containing protein [Thalassolituus]KZY99857.1 hypothetical protein A3746_18265 [Oleibacter sp. HI0075]MAG43602.1 DUF1285 domain-containing protein [Oceanospirillaceae bacterium]MAX86615.1 DUF1285 domain-containing protein [Oceanospirillaceae bacterium]HCG78568.1 DUF1285 domain-containing protein [Oceanospirillales bacterium]|tara:strand:- start:429 stop:947 length:519 start_codon:yes stop_codon:yes gene_type:complete